MHALSKSSLEHQTKLYVRVSFKQTFFRGTQLIEKSLVRRIRWKSVCVATIVFAMFVWSLTTVFNTPKTNQAIEDAPAVVLAEVMTPQEQQEMHIDQEPDGLLHSDIDWISGDFGSGGPFFNQLQKLGMAAADVHQLVSTLQPVYDFRRSLPQHKWQLGFVQGKAVRFSLFVSPTEVHDVYELNGAHNLQRREIKVERRREVFSGTIENSLFGSLSHAPESHALAFNLSQVFAWDIDFYKDPRKGDRVEVLVEAEYVINEQGSNFVGYGPILAARYDGAQGEFSAIRFASEDGDPAYFNHEGKSLVRSVLRSPMKLQRVTGRFNRNRFHPVLKRRRPHNGVDYGAPTGTPVMAVANGRVERASRWGGAGNAVVLQHTGNMETQYFHLSKFADGIRPGVRVKQGQVIGYVGTTGLSTAPHLHFGMKKNGRYVDPLRQKYEPGKPVSKERLAAFETARNDLLSELSLGLPDQVPTGSEQAETLVAD